MVLGTSVVARAAEAEPSFARDVMAVLSKSGCNAGLCHGNLYGKGGFKLSLRGEYAPLDLAAITRDQAARRVDLLSPEQSLLLLKATASIPHEGGKRFDTTAPEYKILRDWIAAGAPSDISKSAALTSITVTPTEKVLVEPTLEVKLTVTAQFADGTQRDVTRMAVYDPADQLVEVTVDGKVKARRLGETTVVVRYLDQQRPVRLAFISDRANFTWSNPPEANGIDRAVFAKLKSLRIQPSGLSTD